MQHKPVLLKETIELLQIQPGQWYIDATLGSAGHTIEILKLGGQVLGIDQDPKAIDRSLANLEAIHELSLPEHQFVNANYSHLKTIARQQGLNQVSGILFDLGVSSEQLADPQTGLSFQTDSPLDMRLDPNLQVTAANLINTLSEKQLIQLFSEFSDEPKSKAIAQLIIRTRKHQPITSTKQLALLAVKAYAGRTKIHGLHPATKIFQALRIAVNSELDNLTQALPQALELLNPGGRLAVISFHSGEDRLVKHFIRQNSKSLQEITQKPVQPTQIEININPRARSAKLRVAEKT